jgi:hypothetical protein
VQRDQQQPSQHRKRQKWTAVCRTRGKCNHPRRVLPRITETTH